MSSPPGSSAGTSSSKFALASAVVGKGWSLYLGNVIGASGSTTAHIGSISFDWGALLIIGAITLILAIGTKVSSRVSAIITAIKIAVVLLVIVVGAFYIKKENYSPSSRRPKEPRALQAESIRPCSPG
ncbi:hypothetical protein GCM10020255_072320 [Rhodococcus baikonurensis]